MGTQAQARTLDTGPASAGPAVVAELSPALPEAPVSASVRVSYRGGYDLQLTIRGTSGRDVLTRLDAALTHLEAKGATPAAPRPSAAPVDPNAPTCPTHGRPMKAGKGGGYFCPAKVAEDDGAGRPVYCRQRVPGGAA